MTDIQTRPRGRPRGSGIDDNGSLVQIADFLVEGRAQNVAAAVRTSGKSPRNPGRKTKAAWYGGKKP